MACICSPKNLFWKKNAILTTPPQVFSITPEQFRSKSEKFTKLSSFHYKNCSLILILWTGRTKFWQTCWNFFAGRPTYFRSTSGRTDKFIKGLIEIWCLKRSPWHVECMYDNIASNTRWKIKNFLKKSEIDFETMNFKKFFFLKIFPRTIRMQFF